MHIPNEMLNGAICPVTAVVSAAGVTAATVFAIRSKEKPTAVRFAAVTALVFAAQMMNFPVQNGTSGHLIGATLAVALLGTPFGILALSVVLAIQSLVFADGGLVVLGANVLNMAIIGSISGAVVRELFIRKRPEASIRNGLLVGAAAWLSVVLASIACSLELAISGTVALGSVLPSMVGVHALIGIGEAVITVAAFSLFSSRLVNRSARMSFVIPLVAAGIIGLTLSPFASGFPDGLEWVAEQLRFLRESPVMFARPLPDYAVPGIGNEIIATGLAGLIGVALTFFTVLGLGTLIKRSAQLIPVTDAGD
jgi:cobalt/nickel transport system permease protein